MTGSFSMSKATQPTTLRSIVYVDGFNLYYGSLRGGPYRWLNLEMYFSHLRPHDKIQKIRYFTAEVMGPAADRQAAYLSALATLPLVEVILGQFKNKQIKGLCKDCPLPDPQFFSVPEEKRTDVNIAIWMLHDAHKDLCDRMILVSGDSDLVPVVAMIKAEYPSKEIIVYVPALDKIRGAATELRAIAHKHRTLPAKLFLTAQLPATIPSSSGSLITKPPTW